LLQQRVLIMIDWQRAFDARSWGVRNNPSAETKALALLTRWRSHGAPIIHIRHRSEDPESRFFAGPGILPKRLLAESPGESVLFKKVNSSFIGTNLRRQLDLKGHTSLVVAGLTTDHCVSTTVRMAANLGYETTVVSDACATFDRVGPDGRLWSAEDLHSSALASLDDEFASVITTSRLLGAGKN
jgi:nicotinamidase-related amidase